MTYSGEDILFMDGCDLTTAPYEERRGWLETLEFSGRSWCAVVSYRSDGVGLLAACSELDLEGLSPSACRLGTGPAPVTGAARLHRTPRVQVSWRIFATASADPDFAKLSDADWAALNEDPFA